MFNYDMEILTDQEEKRYLDKYFEANKRIKK